MRISAQLLPHRDQVPSFVNTDDDLRRFELCFAVTRLIAQRDDPIFCRQLYASDFDTGDLEQYQSS